MSNVFLRLNNGVSRQHETFQTEALTVVLEQLPVMAPTVGVRLMARLAGGIIDLLPKDAGAIEIRTQVEAYEVRPDFGVSKRPGN